MSILSGIPSLSLSASSALVPSSLLLEELVFEEGVCASFFGSSFASSHGFFDFCGSIPSTKSAIRWHVVFFVNGQGSNVHQRIVCARMEGFTLLFFTPAFCHHFCLVPSSFSFGLPSLSHFFRSSFSNIIEQSGFSDVISHSKFFFPSPSISSSHISGIPSWSISQRYVSLSMLRRYAA